MILHNCLLKWIFKISIYFIVLNTCIAQKSNSLNVGVNLFGKLGNTLDFKIEYLLSPSFVVNFSGGHQWKIDVSNSGNSKNSKASGNFVRFETKYFIYKKHKFTKLYISANIIYNSVKHETSAIFRNYFETYEIPFVKYSNHLGPSFGVGFRHIAFKRWELDYSLSMSFPNNSKDYMIGGYVLPGYYFGYQPMNRHTNIYFIPLLMIQYRFFPAEILREETNP